MWGKDLTRVPFVALLVACGSSDPSGLYTSPDGGDPGTFKSAPGGGGLSAGGAGGNLGGSGGATGGSGGATGGSGGATGGSAGEGNEGGSGGGDAGGGGAAGEPSGGAGPVKCKGDKQCTPLVCLKKLGLCGPPALPGTPCDRDLECASDECEDGYCE